MSTSGVISPNNAPATSVAASPVIDQNITNNILKVPRGSNIWQIVLYLINSRAGELNGITDKKDLENKLINFLGRESLQEGEEIDLSAFFRYLNPTNASSTSGETGTPIFQRDLSGLILTVPKGSNIWQIVLYLHKNNPVELSGISDKKDLEGKLITFLGRESLQEGEKINLSEFFEYLKPKTTSIEPSTNSTNPSSIESITPSRYGNQTLRFNSSGEEVKQLQQDLQELSYPINKENYFGPQTEEAVRAFQQKAGISADGEVGPVTKKALIEALTNLHERD